MSYMGTESIKLNDSDEDVQTFGYWVDLEGVKFSDDSDSSWVQAMPLGTWMHPVHGAIVISKDRIKAFADNVNGNVRGQDLDIDYEHKEKISDAAGWVREARVNFSDPDPKARGLYLLVEWTTEAAEKIRAKAFRYFSPEFVTSWIHPATQQRYSDVLFGGALTNRPFLKGILPINLSEMTEHPKVDGTSTDDNEGDNEVDRELLEQIAKSLGVKFDGDMTDADLQSAVSAAADAKNDDGSDSDTDDNDTKDKDKEPVSAGENDDDLVKLAETNPAVAKLMERMEKLEISSRMSDTAVRLTELNDGKEILTPQATTQLSEIMTTTTKEQGDKVFKLVKSLLDGSGTVELKERGGTGDRNGRRDTLDSSDPVQDWDKAVKALTEPKEGEPMSYGDAVEQVSNDDPELYDRYRRGAYAGTTGFDEGSF